MICTKKYIIVSLSKFMFEMCWCHPSGFRCICAHVCIYDFVINCLEVPFSYYSVSFSPFLGKLENVNNLFDDAVTMVYSACLYVFVCVCIWFVRRRHLTMDGDESPHYFIYSISRSFWRCLLLLLSFRLLVFRCEDRVEKCANIRTSLWLSKFFDNPFQLCV